MSAAVENFKKGWLLAVFSLASTVIGVVVAQAVSDNSDLKKDQQDQINNKADVTWVEVYVNKALAASEEKQRIDREWMMKTLDRIDKRTERLEDRIK